MFQRFAQFATKNRRSLMMTASLASMCVAAKATSEDTYSTNFATFLKPNMLAHAMSKDSTQHPYYRSHKNMPIETKLNEADRGNFALLTGNSNLKLA